MSSHLQPCEACGRHVRVTTAVCPFCATALSDAFRASPPRPQPTRRLARAATFAFGAALAVGGVACGGAAPPPSQEQPPPPATPPAQPSPPDVPVAAYGGPPSPPSDDGNVQPLYGVPPD